MKQLKTKHNYIQDHSQSGFSLMVVLAFVGLIATIIVFTVMETRGKVQRDQAQAAGWHLAKIARAARIYVRDRSLDAADSVNHPYHKSRLATGIRVDFNNIINAGLLPDNFTDTNILGQTVEIYAGLSPVTDGGTIRLGTPGDEHAVATAYIYLTPVTLTQKQPELMQELVSGAKQSGLYVDTPLYDKDGNIVSGDCDGDGAADVALWDTSCLDSADFTTITAKAFTQGGLMAPTWRTNDYDNRAVMRYPQPENPGWATMMTTLEMAPPMVNADNECNSFVELTIPDGRGGSMKQQTALCHVHNDTGSADQRVDIVDANSLHALTIVAADQGGSEAQYDASTGVTSYGVTDARTVAGDTSQEVIGVNGPINTTSNVWANGTIAPPAGRNHVEVGDLGIDHNIVVSNKSSIHGDRAGTPGMEVRNGVSVKEMRSSGNFDVAGTLQVKGAAGASNFDISGTVTVNDDCGGAECGLVTENLSVQNKTTVSDTALFLSGFGAELIDVKGNNVGGGAYSTSSILVEGTGNANIGRNITAERSITTDGTAVSNGLLSIQSCFTQTGAGCPDVKEDGPPTNAVDPTN